MATAAATPAPTSAPTKAASAGKYGGNSKSKSKSGSKSKSKSASGDKYGGGSPRVKRVEKELKKWHTKGRHPGWKKAGVKELGYLPAEWVKTNHLNPDILEKRRQKVNRFTKWLNNLDGYFPRHIDQHVVGW